MILYHWQTFHPQPWHSVSRAHFRQVRSAGSWTGKSRRVHRRLLL